MNRELRRIQKKADEKKGKEKTKNKQKRVSKIQNKRQKRKDKIIKKSNSKSKSSKSGFNTDRSKFAVRMAAPFTIFTAFFIGVQVFVPTKESDTFNPAITQAIEIAYYLFFGHFLMIWLLKRGMKKALWYAIPAGLILTAGLQAANYLVNQNLNLQVLAFGSMAAVAGSISGHFFYRDLATSHQPKSPEPVAVEEVDVEEEETDGKA